ncbi:MAG TPA: hypothetical protein VEU08_09015 [Vicinamibacterales bacterium]|nr:hypothetical protein [Vicinamibacterales bacterium]
MKRALLLLAFALVAAVARAQFQMPDPKQMSGIPRPVSDLPDHAISVRLIRGDLSNNITNHPVELKIGSKSITVKTDEGGRAQFNDVPAGVSVKAVADVDGEHLESQEFPGPSQGGVRLMLVATDKTKGPATEPEAPAISGAVVITDQSRIVLQPADESLEVFYLLDVENSARVPVNPTTPFAFDLPAGTVGAGVMDGSSPLASVKGTKVTVAGPFPPGHTFIQIAGEIPTESGDVDITQRFPANVQGVAVIVKKVGATTLVSPQIASQREMPADGETYIAGTGGAVAAGQPIALTVGGVPHQSRAPRFIAIALAAGVVVVGLLLGGGTPPDDTAERAAARKRLHAKKDKLLNDLVRLETDRRAGRVDDHRYAARREELIALLEPIFGALDADDRDASTPGAGLAA